MSIIVDGTGSGARAAVDNDNRLKVNAISEDAYIHAAEEGRAFNLNTKQVIYSGAGPQTKNCLYVKNNESSDLEIVGWFIGEKGDRTGGDTSEPILFEMYGSPTGTAAGTEIKAVNRRIGDPREFDLTCIVEPTGVVPQTADPLLFQYHYGGRAFGTVNFTIPSGASILLQANIPSDSVTFYTGFTGYIRGE